MPLPFVLLTVVFIWCASSSLNAYIDYRSKLHQIEVEHQMRKEFLRSIAPLTGGKPASRVCAYT
jgi:hypothetical protein